MVHLILRAKYILAIQGLTILIYGLKPPILISLDSLTNNSIETLVLQTRELHWDWDPGIERVPRDASQSAREQVVLTWVGAGS